MFDAGRLSPLESLLGVGRFGFVQEGQRPTFTLRPMPYLSICRVIPFGETIERFRSSLKGMLGLTVPPAREAFTAGTRIALRPDDSLGCFIVTEGEAEQVLYHRLYTPLMGECAVFDVTHGLVVLRFEGFQTEQILGSGCEHQLNLQDYPEGHVQDIVFDGVKVMVHRSEQDRWILYIPRSYAQVVYTWLVRCCLPLGIQLYAV